jgi:alpha-ribazole phosphatase
MPATMIETNIWIIRHGEPEATAQGLCYGRLDVGLSPEGRQQLERVADQFRHEPLAAIYASPLKRAVESATILERHHSCGIEILEGVREIDFGDFEGVSYDEIAQSYPEIYRDWMERPTATQFPKGESFGRMRKRVVETAELLRSRHANQSVALVTHGGVARIMLAEALDISGMNIFRIAQRYAAINRIRYLNTYPSVELVNGAA